MFHHSGQNYKMALIFFIVILMIGDNVLKLSHNASLMQKKKNAPSHNYFQKYWMISYEQSEKKIAGFSITNLHYCWQH